jgi:hypothetical protein
MSKSFKPFKIVKNHPRPLDFVLQPGSCNSRDHAGFVLIGGGFNVRFNISDLNRKL